MTVTVLSHFGCTGGTTVI